MRAFAAVAALTLLFAAPCEGAGRIGSVVSRRPTVAHRAASPAMAMVIPGESLPELILVDGSLNFLSLYSGIITLRILLSWFPQAQSVAFLRPVFTSADVYLNLFRGIVPPIGGIDISPIGAFFVLNLLQSSVASLGAPLPGSAGALPSPRVQKLGQRFGAARQSLQSSVGSLCTRFAPA